MKNNPVLLTGCGGDIAISIANILREQGFNKIYGTDIHADHPGAQFYDKCFVVPRAGSPDYLDFIDNICAKESVTLVIPLSEIEIARFNEGPRKRGAATIIMADKNTIDICLNKLKTSAFLKEHGIPVPWTKLVSSGPPESLPCIIKHPQSQGSKSVSIVEPEFVNYFTKKRPEFIWQELLLPNDEEYTCGLYRTLSGEIRTMQIRRKLADGISVSGVVTDNSSIDEVLYQIAKALDLRGSINVQLRLTAKGPMTFEINPRFSSTVRFRHMLGFKDVMWSIEEMSGLPLGSFSKPLAGKKIFRHGQEIVF